MKKKTIRLTECPSGLMEKNINEALFCEEFLQTAQDSLHKRGFFHARRPCDR